MTPDAQAQVADRPLLEVRGLAVSYGNLAAVRAADLSVPAGRLIALLGPNGAGKTTTLSSVAGLLRPGGGSIRLADRELAGLPAHRVARTGVRLVPENRELFPDLSVVENLQVGAGRLRAADFRSRLERIVDLFPVLGERRDQRAGTMSGGEQQMLSIARALIAAPKVLLLDEPSMGLAPRIVTSIMAATGRLRDEGLAILVAEQNARAVLPVADRAVVMTRGRTVREDSPQVVERLLETHGYLGPGVQSLRGEADGR